MKLAIDLVDSLLSSPLRILIEHTPNQGFEDVVNLLRLGRCWLQHLKVLGHEQVFGFIRIQSLRDL